MAMTNLTWNTVTFAAPSLLNWPPGVYGVPAAFVAAVNAGSNLQVFCIEDNGPGGSATIAFEGGVATIPSSVITVLAVLSLNTQVMDDGETWYSTRVGTSGWYFYATSFGAVRAMTDSSALGAFIS